METEIPYIVSIAGFDPSGGAGILADIKTFEMNKVHGLAVCTSLTFQNEKEFEGLNWVPVNTILQQLEVLARAYRFEGVKIGLLENLEVLEVLINWVTANMPDCKIIWDPILKASAGFEFHNQLDVHKLEQLCAKIYLITPNKEEIQRLYPELSAEEGALKLASFTNVLLKGGHDQSELATDIMYKNDEKFVFEGPRLGSDKHGTGCILSAAILSNLALGYELEDACREAKEYVSDYIKSDESLLGFHYGQDC